jgi:hypothetical protein
MSRLMVLCLVLLTAGLAPSSGWAQAGLGSASGGVAAGGMRPVFRPPVNRPPVNRPPIIRPRPPIAPFFPCCADFSYFPDEPPPMVAPPPPTVIYIIPSPPPLVYIPTPRVQPAPEIASPKGTWARHGNGKEYPYTWVFQPAYPAR